MATLFEIQKEAGGLSLEEKAGLIAHLLKSFPDPPSGPDDAEVVRRGEEMDSGEVIPIAHEQFLAELGRR